MSHDEQRKKIFELECALGKAIKISEQTLEGYVRLQKQNKILCDINEAFASGIKLYVNGGSKHYLLDAVDIAQSKAKLLNIR
jgi:hypothetical protein